ncbi:hypothetical protein [Saccharothrix longispora]|uniref:hypothetical protein n=1 Tax=Saccharothrix longispora TaxID=33920 RepID=UPI0028FCFF4C|nr:hypothetical protein [Saccharothrix longispora]MBY8847267.1 hypothetical protein [Saccharothrix sp. MB29]MDU0293213.1 hypothetical protein [Saccharothrix longispora]
MTIPGLPEHRPLPPEVRARLRADFEDGIDRPRHRTAQSALTAVAAAAVTALVVGAVVVLRDVPDLRPAAPPPPLGGSLGAVGVEAALDRCWSALRAEDLADAYPDRSLWTPVWGEDRPEIDVVAARAAGEPLFCQTTATTATVSDLNGLLVTREGVVAGTTDAAAPVVAGTGAHGPYDVEADVADHLYIAMTHTNPTGMAITVDGVPLPGAGAPAAVVRDRADGPEPDRESEAGRLLGDCLATASKPVVDPDSYRPGAHVDGLVLGRSATRLVVCRAWPVERVSHARPRTLEALGFPVRFHYDGHTFDGAHTLAGQVPADAAGMTVSVDGGAPVRAVVADGTFVLRLDPEVALVPGVTPLRVEVLDGRGAVILDGEVLHSP